MFSSPWQETLKKKKKKNLLFLWHFLSGPHPSLDMVESTEQLHRRSKKGGTLNPCLFRIDYCRRDLTAIMAHMLPYNYWKLFFLCHSPLDVWGKNNKGVPNITRNNEGRRGRRVEEIREKRQIGVGDGRTWPPPIYSTKEGIVPGDKNPVAETSKYNTSKCWGDMEGWLQRIKIHEF